MLSCVTNEALTFKLCLRQYNVRHQSNISYLQTLVKDRVFPEGTSKACIRVSPNVG